MDIHKQTAHELRERRDELSQAIVKEYYQRDPSLLKRYGEEGRKHVLQDNAYHLAYLSRALMCDSPALFNDYIAWAKIFLTNLDIPAEDLEKNLRTLGDVLRDSLPPEMASCSDIYLSEAINILPELPTEIGSFLRDDNPQKELVESYLGKLLDGKRKEASAMITGEVPDNVGIRDAYMNIFEPCQHEIGRLWQTNEISVAQEHYCTAATQLIMSRLYPHLFNEEQNGRVLVATCIAEDLHELGIRMVADFFELEGWDTYYLGANTPKKSVIRSVQQQNADILAISATMTYHIDAVAELIAETRESCNGQDLKILVGGYPFKCEPSLWETVGADGFSLNAREALVVADELFSGERDG